MGDEIVLGGDGTATKPWLSGNMLPSKHTCENRWSNFSENLRVVALKYARVNSKLKSKVLFRKKIYKEHQNIHTVTHHHDWSVN